MTEKIYLTASDLQKRWEISAPTFAKMRDAGTLPKATVMATAARYHIDDVLEWESEK